MPSYPSSTTALFAGNADNYATKQELRRAAGNMMICGFEGSSVTAELKEILREVNPLGLILFSRNIESAEQVTEFARELKLLRKEQPLLLAVDQEGGRVQRIKEGATLFPDMATLGEINDPQLTFQVAQALGNELTAMNFDLNFAPVLDVNTNASNPVIGNRAFGDHPERVGIQAIAFAKGLSSSGIAACGKHFPGHGDTSVDSHLELAFVEHDLDRLHDVEWRPFKMAIQAGLDAIMSAHVVVRPLDATHPATLSSVVLGHLRKTLHFNGILFSDDIDMKALADHYTPDEIALQGFRAGIDIFLACKNPASMLELYRGLVTAAERKEIAHNTLLMREKRILSWRHKHYRPTSKMAFFEQYVGSVAHQLLIQEIDRRSQAGE